MNESTKKFYITAAIPYVNARPHIGHALEFVETDALARYHRLRGEEVLILSGSDENAIKNVHAAEQAGVDTQTFIDANAKLFQDLAEKLDVRFDVFQKGTDRAHHFPSSQKLWQLCNTSGDIYKKSYEGLYCIGCETFYNREELNEKGECCEHPGRKLEIVSEENYFFRLSKYREELAGLISSDALKIIPVHRKNEMLSFLSGPLEDISISRTNERAKNWGVPVPDDPTQRMYVWFDALNIYQSGIGFGWDEARYKKWWPADMHVIGKGIIRFHAVYWPAFLLSAGLALPKQLFVHGYVTVDGQKMSKTLGNVIDPVELINQYGVDPVRYYLLREIPSYEDGDFSHAKFVERYNGDLANGLGNLVARVAALGDRIGPVAFDFSNEIRPVLHQELDERFRRYQQAFGDVRLHEALSEIWRLIAFTDRYINDTQPWAITDREEFRKVIVRAGWIVLVVANLLVPFLPGTAERIFGQFRIRDGVFEIKKGEGLFPRLG